MRAVDGVARKRRPEESGTLTCHYRSDYAVGPMSHLSICHLFLALDGSITSSTHMCRHGIVI